MLKRELYRRSVYQMKDDARYKKKIRLMVLHMSASAALVLHLDICYDTVVPRLTQVTNHPKGHSAGVAHNFMIYHIVNDVILLEYIS